MELKGKRAIILVEQMFNLFEFWYPYYRLKEAGAEVLVIGPTKGGVYSGKEGTEVRAEKTPGDISPADFDALVIPGGYAPDHMRRYPSMVKLVREIFERGKVVAAICHAGWMLASAEIVRERARSPLFLPSRMTWFMRALTGWTRRWWWTETSSRAENPMTCRPS